jgi:Putative peptidoglycan binding domain
LIAGGEKDPERVPVASSPAGLLKPGAEQKVREKLGSNAKGEALRPALQRFQREHDLPATGILDHRTAKELGLDPDDLFERARD